jgi:hypothetical protein
METFNFSQTVPHVVEDLAPVAQDVMRHFESQDFGVAETLIPREECRSASAGEASSRARRVIYRLPTLPDPSHR